MPLIPSPSGTLDVLEWGSGDELVVLLHASATGPRSLKFLAERLGCAGRRVIAPAFAGYGQRELIGGVDSDRVNTNRSIVSEVLAQQYRPRRVLFGHSMGGLIALLTAMDEAQRATPVDALILYEPILIDLLDLQRPDHNAARAWDRAIIDRLAFQVCAGQPEAGVRAFVEAWNDTHWEALPDAARQQLIANADNLTQETTAVSNQKIDRARISALSTPTLLLRGTQSPPLIALTTEIAVNALPNAHQSVLPDCGHVAPVLNPAPVADCIESFLQCLASQHS